MVRFLYFFLLCSMICNLFPSLFRKCGYCRENANSNSVSSKPEGGNGISLLLKVRLLLCIFTAITKEEMSASNCLWMASLARVREQRRGMQLGGGSLHLPGGKQFHGDGGAREMGMGGMGLLDPSHPTPACHRHAYSAHATLISNLHWAFPSLIITHCQV